MIMSEIYAVIMTLVHNLGYILYEKCEVGSKD